MKVNSDKKGDIMIKLIATDMDGTLLDKNGQINHEFDGIFKRLIEKDIKFVVASGRQYFRLKEDFKEYSDQIVFIADNGSMVMYRDEKIHSKSLKDEYVGQIIDYIKQDENLEMVLSGKKKAYLDADKEDIIDEIKKYYKEYEIVEDLAHVQEEILKIAVYSPNSAEKTYNKILKQSWGDKVKVSLSGEIWIDIYSEETNKGIAIKMIQEKFGIKKEETMAFGDYFNDVEMLQEAKYSYAMENAPEDFKKYANFIAGSNEENGVLEVIKEIVL